MHDGLVLTSRCTNCSSYCNNSLERIHTRTQCLITEHQPDITEVKARLFKHVITTDVKFLFLRNSVISMISFRNGGES